MHTLVKTAGAIVMAGAVALGGVAPAAAAMPWWWYHRHHHHHFVHYYPAPAYPYYYYRTYPAYGYYPYYYDPGAAVAAGIIGGIFGTIAHQAIHHHR
ncbi:MAG: hypothetical protein ACTHOR_07465 [Devosia sp.]|jgi:hypothetical protein|nr:hypothetical protein [Devosiaceae bacterium]